MMSTARMSTATTATAVTVEDLVMTEGGKGSLGVKMVTQLDGHDDINPDLRDDAKRGCAGSEGDDEKSVNEDRTQESTSPFSTQMV